MRRGRRVCLCLHSTFAHEIDNGQSSDIRIRCVPRADSASENCFDYDDASVSAVAFWLGLGRRSEYTNGPRRVQ